jgi:hypothetical protein
MTDRELMQQALDALDKLLDKLNADICDNSGIWDEYCDGGNAMQALRARLAQPEPEPVAKMREMLEVQGRDGTWNYDPYFHGMYNGMEFMLALAEGRDPVFRKAPEKWLNAPPQREWQGLTDEDYEAMAEKYVTNCYFDTLKYSRAIEAKLKEKNT